VSLQTDVARDVASEVASVRQRVALTECEHVVGLRLSGPSVFEIVDAICPCELYLQDGQMLHTLLLDETACPVADAYVCADGQDFVLITEGLSPDELRAYLRQCAPAGLALDIRDLGQSQRPVSLNGPYAWELLSAVLSAEVIGLPYLGFYHGSGFTCFRAGKTGEYGYDLWLDRSGDDGLLERLLNVGGEYGLGRAGLSALDACSLENWVFNMRREGRARLSPIELQLQWRLSYRKAFPGSARLGELRRAGPRRRAVLVASEHELSQGDVLCFAGEPVGEVVLGERSPTRGDVLGIAVLAMPHAHPGVGSLEVARSGASTRVISAPAVNNRSLYVDPQRHSYGTRSEHVFPPIWSTGA